MDTVIYICIAIMAVLFLVACAGAQGYIRRRFGREREQKILNTWWIVYGTTVVAIITAIVVDSA